MYQSIDLALDKLERQIHRFKGKLRAHKPSRANAARTLDVAVVALPEDDIDDEVAETLEAELADEAAVEDSRARIIKHEAVALAEMSVDDAAMKLSLEDLPVVVFIDADSHRTNILYRLEDGKFGLMPFGQ